MSHASTRHAKAFLAVASPDDKENKFGAGAFSRSSHRAMYSLQDGGSHCMNLATAGVMHAKTSSASD
ncbi:MAG TPA: hypothetical protein VN684_05590, partial [Terriglobales bacterium]|nr:hypothetical protein [Terriglobales bacterium]